MGIFGKIFVINLYLKNLTMNKIKLSRKKSIAATSYKIQNGSTNPTVP